jgi:hypothetical protein
VAALQLQVLPLCSPKNMPPYFETVKVSRARIVRASLACHWFGTLIRKILSRSRRSTLEAPGWTPSLSWRRRTGWSCYLVTVLPSHRPLCTGRPPYNRLAGIRRLLLRAVRHQGQHQRAFCHTPDFSRRRIYLCSGCPRSMQRLPRGFRDS